MIHRLSFEAVDRAICDIMNTPSEGPSYKPFGCKTVLLGGDFRQTLPIVPNAGRETNLNASLTRSYLWNHCTLLELKTNMRVNASSINLLPISSGLNFPKWVLAVGVYPDFTKNYQSMAYIRTRAIVTPTNQVVSDINDYVLTRILLTHLGDHTLRGLIIGGSHEGTIAIISRIVLDKTDPNWPFTLKRRQYPLRLCYAMTINKSQRQTLEHIGIYLPSPVFSHGQLYVALSRARSVEGIHIILQSDGTLSETTTRNIVYQEIFEDLRNNARCS
ncbi:ATP-dependent DNA helicase PIF1 [Linum perenne]